MSRVVVVLPFCVWICIVCFEVQVRLESRLYTNATFPKLYVFSNYAKTPLTSGEGKHREVTWIPNVRVCNHKTHRELACWSKPKPLLYEKRPVQQRDVYRLLLLLHIILQRVCRYIINSLNTNLVKHPIKKAVAIPTRLIKLWRLVACLLNLAEERFWWKNQYTKSSRINNTELLCNKYNPAVFCFLLLWCLRPVVHWLLE